MKVIELQKIHNYNCYYNKTEVKPKAKKKEERNYETSFLKILIPEMQRNNCIKSS